MPDKIGDLTANLETLIIGVVLLAAVVTIVQVVMARKSPWPAVPAALAGALALWMVNSVDEIAWWSTETAHEAYEEGGEGADRGRFTTGEDRDHPNCLPYYGPVGDMGSEVRFLVCPEDHPQVDEGTNRGP